MTRRRLIGLVLGALLVVTGVWIARHTYWEQITVPMPMRGEARSNPFYVAQHLTDALGAHGIRDIAFAVPPDDAVLVLSELHWSLSASRRRQIEQWVERGGRLVVDDSVVWDADFQHWSGVVAESPDLTDDDTEDVEDDPASNGRVSCRPLTDTGPITSQPSGPAAAFMLCDFTDQSVLTTDRTSLWRLSDETGPQVLRVAVGRGTVTAVNGMRFTERALFDGDHAALFATMAQLRTGDEVHFLTETNYPSIVSLIWQHGGPAVVLAALLIVLWLWRSSVSFGPSAPVAAVARRALADQILATGEFTARLGGSALHGATVRALDDAVFRQRPGAAQLPLDERRALVQRVTGLDAATLAAPDQNGRLHLADAIRALETARRLITPKGIR